VRLTLLDTLGLPVALMVMEVLLVNPVLVVGVLEGLRVLVQGGVVGMGEREGVRVEVLHPELVTEPVTQRVGRKGEGEEEMEGLEEEEEEEVALEERHCVAEPLGECGLEGDTEGEKVTLDVPEWLRDVDLVRQLLGVAQGVGLCEREMVTLREKEEVGQEECVTLGV